MGGASDWDQDLINLYSAGTITSSTDQAKVRLHTDGYKATLSSTFAVDLTAQASSEKYFNCIGKSGDTTSGTPGAYCLYAFSTSAGNEGLMELHWIAQTAMAV